MLDSSELPSNGNSDTPYEGGNLGHRIRDQGRILSGAAAGFGAGHARRDARRHAAAMGAKVEKHHHEVASAQHELGLKFGPLTQMADHMQVYKYCIHQRRAELRKDRATFMPKPIFGDNGSGMHVHQSIWKGGKPIFSPATNTPTSARSACGTSAASSSTRSR